MFGALKKGIKSFSDKLGLTKPVQETPKPKDSNLETKPIFNIEKPKSIEKEVVKKVKVEARVEAKSKEKLIEKVKSNEVQITYFTHGTTYDNEQKLFSGQNDVVLSELGKQHVKELFDKLEFDYNLVFTSDLPRAVESVNLTWPNKEIIQDKRLREIDVGDLTSKKESLVEEYIENNGFDKQFPNGESIKDLEKRIISFLNYLYENYRGKSVAVLAHKYTQLAIDVLLKNISWNKAIEEDWRKKKAWQPGWKYTLKNKIILEESVLDDYVKTKETSKEEIVVKESNISEESKKVKTSIFTKLKSVFSEKYYLNENELNDLIDGFELSLLQSDVSLKVSELLTNNLKEKLKKEGVSKTHQEEYLKKIFLDIIFENYPKALNEDFFNQSKKPLVVLFVGTNGSGKTTNIAKLAYNLKSKGKSVVLAASDTYRAAAIDQLEGHANALNVPIVKGKYGQDPASVAYDAVSFAKTKNIDFVLIDSSGRQDNAINLMKELEKIKTVVCPDFIVFVAEAIAGQTALMQAESFDKYTNFNAFILTKADVDEKGGTLLSISLGLKKPVLFLGIGQEYKDIAFFNKDFLENVI